MVESDENLHELIVTKMNHVPQIKFGPMDLGTSQVKQLRISNPTESSSKATVKLSKFTKPVGFHSDFEMQ